MSRFPDDMIRSKPIVFIEDHLYHIDEILGILEASAPTYLAQIAIICLDRPGPDTVRAVSQWLARFPDLLIAARPAGFEGLPTDDAARLIPLEDAVFESGPAYCKQVTCLLRPGGLLVSDIQLDTLGFLPGDRWWESIYLANMIRGMYGSNPPSFRFMSNKSGFEITFGKDLLDAGFDPRDVLDKNTLSRTLKHGLTRYCDRTFPFLLQTKGADGWLRDEWILDDTSERAAIEAQFDLVLWRHREDDFALGGRLIKPRGDRTRHGLKQSSHETQTWTQLVDAFLQDKGGVPVQEVGIRVAPEGALKAEWTNIAARHIHSMRARLMDAGAIVTVDSAYRLRPQLRVARILPRLPDRNR